MICRNRSLPIKKCICLSFDIAKIGKNNKEMHKKIPHMPKRYMRVYEVFILGICSMVYVVYEVNLRLLLYQTI